MKALAEAMRFLTTLPIPGKPPKHRWMVMAAYPWAGLIIGILAALGTWLGSWILGAGGCAVLAVVLKTVLTGGLHMDGLADLADGMGGGRDRDKRLAIMSDSRLGSFGALALIAMFALQAAAIAGILSRSAMAGPMDWSILLPLVLAPIISRGIIVLVIPAFPTARPGGMGDSNRRDSVSAAQVSAGLAVLVLAAILSGWGGLITAAGTAAVMFLTARRISGRLGGLTGDAYGAVLETGDLAVYFLVLVLLKFEIPAAGLLSLIT